MSRDELFNSIVATVGATSEVQLAKVSTSLNDVVLLIQLRNYEEILISEMNTDNLKNITDEVVRRYRA